MANWNWFWKRKKKQPPRRSKPRRLVLEHLEPRQLLSGNPFAATLAKVTPDPQPSGDQPSAEAATVSLAAYTPAAINDPGVAPLEPYFDGLRQIYSQILDNPAARPAFWGEPVAGSAGQYELHFCDNGMLVNVGRAEIFNGEMQ